MHSISPSFRLKQISLTILLALANQMATANDETKDEVKIVDTVSFPISYSEVMDMNDSATLIAISASGYQINAIAERLSPHGVSVPYRIHHLKSDDSELTFGRTVAILEDASILGYTHSNPFGEVRVQYYIWHKDTTGEYTPQKLDVDTSQGSILLASRDKKVFVGFSKYDDADRWQPTIYLDDFKTKIRLPNLRSDGATSDEQGFGEILALSHDGKIVGGRALADDGEYHAVIYSGEHYKEKTKLEGGAGIMGGVFALSADGKIAAGGGYSSHITENGTSATIRAPVVWRGDNYSEKIELPYLQEGRIHPRASERGGRVSALSSDGKVAGGSIYVHTDDTSNYAERQAAVWSGQNYATLTVLGTLKSDNTGSSRITHLNSDGTIAAGESEGDNHRQQATLWKIEYPSMSQASTTPPVTPPTDTTPPSTPPVTPVTPPTDTTPVTPPSTVPVTPPVTPVIVSKIDVANTVQTITNLGADSFSLMAMQSHALDRLQYTCRAVQGFCFGTQQDFNVSRDNNDHKIRDIAVGVNAGYGFHNGVSVGVSLDHAINRKLPDSYRHEGDDIGVGAVLRYQSPNGYFGELSGAYDDYTATISRPLLPNTELGVNEANIQGISYGIKVGKEFGDSHRYRAYIGAKQRDISRDAYTENDHTAFPISYGKMTHKDTTATLGLSSHIGMTPKLSWVTDVSGEYRLNDDKPTYTASLTGVEKHDFSYSTEPKKWRGHFATGVRYHVLPTTHLEIMPYVGENATGEGYYGGTLRLESRF